MYIVYIISITSSTMQRPRPVVDCRWRAPGSWPLSRTPRMPCLTGETLKNGYVLPHTVGALHVCIYSSACLGLNLVALSVGEAALVVPHLAWAHGASHAQNNITGRIIPCFNLKALDPGSVRKIPAKMAATRSPRKLSTYELVCTRTPGNAPFFV